MTTFIQTSHGSYITQQQQQQATSPPNLVNTLSSCSSSINPQAIYTSSSSPSSSIVSGSSVTLSSLPLVSTLPSSSSLTDLPISSNSNDTTSLTSLTTVSSISLPPVTTSSGFPSVTPVSSFSLSTSSPASLSSNQQQQQTSISSVQYSSSGLPCSLSSSPSTVYAIPASPSQSSLSGLTSSSGVSSVSHLQSHQQQQQQLSLASSISVSGSSVASGVAGGSFSSSSESQLIHTTQSFGSSATTLISSQGGSLVLSPRNVPGLSSYSTANQTTIMLPLQGNGNTNNGTGSVNDHLIGNQILSSIPSSQQIVSPMVPLLLTNGQFISTGIPSQGAFSLPQSNSTSSSVTQSTTTSSQQSHPQSQQYQFGNFIGTSLATSLPNNGSTQFVTNGSGQIFAISPSIINNLNQQQSSAINSLQTHQSSSAFIQVVTPNGIALVPANQIISDQPLMSTISTNQMDNSSIHQQQQQLLQQHQQQTHHNSNSGLPERERTNKRGNQKNFYSRTEGSGGHSGPSHSRMLKKSALAQAQLQQLQQQQMNQAIQVSLSSSVSTSSTSTSTTNTKNSGRIVNSSNHAFAPSSLSSLTCYNRSTDVKPLAMNNNSSSTNCSTQQAMYLGSQTNTIPNSVESQTPSPPLSTASSMEPESNQATVAQTINNGDVAVVDGVNLEEVKEFARQFKLRRLSLGLTQTQVGQALSATAGPSYSQSAICRFEKLDITPKSASKIKPVLEKWMHDLEIRCRQGNTDPASFTGNPNSKKRKRRTSFSPSALEVLNIFFEKNTHPSSSEMTELADKLKYDREVVRVWFCNKRQVLRNNVKKSDPPLSLLTLTSRAAKAKSSGTVTTGTSTNTNNGSNPSNNNSFN